MAKVGWSKVDTVLRYVGVAELSALQSQSNYRHPKSIVANQSLRALSLNVFFEYFLFIFRLKSKIMY